MKFGKKVISAALALAAIVGIPNIFPMDSHMSEMAKPTPHAIYVDGEKANVAAYEISGNNYFKLRDIAAIVNGSEKQFEVSWNEAQQRIDLTSGKPYTTVGGELGAISSANQSANASTAVVYKDGSKADYTGYNINDNNFYKLRDVCQSFDIGVEWDSATQRVDIITTESYVPEGQQTTEEPETPVTEPEEPAVEPEPEPETPDINTDLGQPDDTEVPAVNEYTKAYEEFLNTCGEEIVTKTVKYRIVSKGAVPYERALDLIVATFDSFSGEHTYVKSIRSNSDGTGEFTLKMPQSYYDATMAGDKQFIVELVGGSNWIDGEYFVLAGGGLDKYAFSGYQVQFQAMF